MKNIRLILISGLSGSGKTTAIKALEDVGYYCVDNLPILLLPQFLELCEKSGGKISKVAVVKDIREEASRPVSRQLTDPVNGEKFTLNLEDTGEDIDLSTESRRIIQDLKRKGYRIDIIFLESKDTILIKRFSETRRQHPLAVGGSIRDGLHLERKRLQFIRDMADQVIDTTTLSVHELKQKIQQYVQEEMPLNRLTVSLISFGYSYGIPTEAEMVMDVRFLPNPYFIEGLRSFNGTHSEVFKYVMQWDETKELLQHLERLIRFLLPLYQREMKTHLTIAVGCTGGKHRSVAIINRLAEIFKAELEEKGFYLLVRHRDIEKG
ncbi:MAG: RNase adapter RapZ [Deltaproteobacteria bacterium]|nr:MAG: RNase adapter RapZ [Deltaproteobacteria bacterium]